MGQAVNRYRCDLRDMRFLLFEQFRLDDLLGKPPYADWSRDDAIAILGEVYKWSCEVLGPINAGGDRVGCVLGEGRVRTPPGFREAWKSLYQAGWRGIGVNPEHGGQGGPLAVSLLAGEMMSGANTAFNMYTGLSQGVAEVIETFGTPEQVATYCRKLFTGVYAGTMCLTEAHAGSDVGAALTRATPVGDGTYRIEGTKIFISAGDHDLTDNIIHLVLARTPDAPAGTKGLSLFIVPRDVPGGGHGSNHVVTASIEHKMGINGSATAVLAFGEGGPCIGELVGREERRGMAQMFKMMNLARIGVGLQGLAVAGAAYLCALEYAGQRVQGAHIKNWKDPNAPKVPIIQHPNIRRMLLDMKARVEGIRALIVKLGVHRDRELAARAASDERAAEHHLGQIDLLVPVVKAYASDQGFQVTVLAIQCLGGAGYINDHPVEQYCRDSKIFSIYEGTNHIQALDLVGRKLGLRGGANFQAYVEDVRRFAAEHRADELAPVMDQLDAAAGALSESAMRMLGWSHAGKTELIDLYANRFLEMMARTTVAWVLLAGAAVARRAGRELPDQHPDRAFYQGKFHAAMYYAKLELPAVVDGARFMAQEMRHSLDIADLGFGRFE